MPLKNSKKILIIDDDDRNIFALEAVLKAKGFDCISAISGKDGLLLLTGQTDIGIALIDVMMPKMDGFEMIKEIRAMPDYAFLSIIAVTAQAMPGDREKCLSAGANDYVSKPIDIEILLKIIAQYLNQSSLS